MPVFIEIERNVLSCGGSICVCLIFPALAKRFSRKKVVLALREALENQRKFEAV
jgi:hypothetical protein